MFNFWRSAQTAWVYEMGHRVGLNYASIQICLMHWPGKKKKKSEMFFLVQAMEHAVLDEISKKRK